MKNFLLFTITCILLHFSSFVWSEETSGSCSFSSEGSVTFGIYETVNVSDNESIGQLSYSCEGTINNISMHFSKGNAPDFQRFMLGQDGDRLFYNLYIDAARQQILGDNTSGSVVHSNSNIVAGALTVIPIYGKIPARQDVSAGIYSDTIMITVQF